MARAVRFDFAELSPPTRMANGWLRVDSVVTRAGIFEYRDRGGKVRRELRPPEEVFDSDSLASFRLLPVTDDHPPAMLDAKNTALYARGVVSEDIRRDGDVVRASMLITDADMIATMEKGRRQVSAGYQVELDETPGHHPTYGRYDAVQRQIRGNHVALVDRARAGPEARVRLDSWAAQLDRHEDVCLPSPRSDAMNEQQQKIFDAAIAEAAASKSRLDKLEADLATERKRADQLAGALDASKERVAELEKARADSKPPEAYERQVRQLDEELKSEKRLRKDAEDNFDGAVRARVKLELDAARILGDRGRLDKMTDREVMIAVLAKSGTVDKDKSDDYLRSKFDGVVENFDATEAVLDKLQEQVIKAEKAKADPRTARQRMVDEYHKPRKPANHEKGA